LPWCPGGEEHSDGTKGEGMIKRFDFSIGSEYRSENITKWDADRRTENERPIEVDEKTRKII
jgi:hypothetical protein